MLEMKDSDNRGQGSRSDKAVTKTVRLGDLHWKLERLDAVHRQLLTGLLPWASFIGCRMSGPHTPGYCGTSSRTRPTASLRPSWWPS